MCNCLKSLIFAFMVVSSGCSYGKEICNKSSSKDVLFYLDGIEKTYYQDKNIGNIFFILSEWDNPESTCFNVIDDEVQIKAIEYAAKLLRSGFYCHDIFRIEDRMDQFYIKYRGSRNQEILVDLAVNYILFGKDGNLSKIRYLFSRVDNIGKEKISINLPKMCLKSHSKLYGIFDSENSSDTEHRDTFERHLSLRQKSRICEKLARQRFELCGSTQMVR